MVVGALLAPMTLVRAQGTVNIRASDLRGSSDLFVSPRTASFLDGSTFEVPVYINTNKKSINAIDLRIKFNADVLTIVNPSEGKSIIGIWVEPPTYDNTKGTAHLVGTIPGGISTDSGLITTLVFRAKVPGTAVVSISDASQVLLNDGAGTATDLNVGRGTYTITPRPPEGVKVYSETHPFQDKWYNNNNPTISWDKDPGVTGFSFELDSKPTTIPGNNIVDTTVKSYPDLSDGIWYFHIKALKAGVWGNTTHFLVKIDTTPPAAFKPTLEYLGAAVINRFLVSYSTTDNLSGVDHYEVGVIDKSRPVTEAPAFVEASSPYQLPFDTISSARLIVRAFDRAGNIRDVSVDAKVPFLPTKIIVDNAVMILLTILIIIIIAFIVHYFYGHKIIRKIERGVQLLKNEEAANGVQPQAPNQNINPNRNLPPPPQ